jgi:SWI/SNF-related matrix-associated actin-dependent regulator 1 of chromatin subfamily A
MEPMELFLPKKATLGNFLIEDYHNVQVDFNRYNLLSSSKDPNRKIKEHQKEAVQFLLSRKKCVLADDMGVGKSLELSVASIEGNFDSVLIICPASLKTNWKKELMWYTPERDITIIDSPIRMTKPELEKYLGYKEGRSGLTVKELQEEAKDKGKWEDNRFVIVNFDILEEFYKIPTTRSKENLQKALEESPMLQYILNKKSLIIIDEAHRLSNDTSIRYKIIDNLIKRGKPDSVYLATGTPITNNPQNFYCLLKLINDPITDDWQYYMDRYCGAMKIPPSS